VEASVKGGEFCEHGVEAGRCQDEQCPGYWLDADDPQVPALLDDLYAEAWLGELEDGGVVTADVPNAAYAPGDRVTAFGRAGTVLGMSGRFVVVQLDGDDDGPSNWHPSNLRITRLAP
jgi:hypothetical protein